MLSGAGLPLCPSVDAPRATGPPPPFSQHLTQGLAHGPCHGHLGPLGPRAGRRGAQGQGGDRASREAVGPGNTAEHRGSPRVRGSWVGRGVGAAPQRVLGGQNPGPVQGHSMRQLWLGGGAGVPRWGQGGQLCPAHVTRRPMALAWVRGWEQLASGRPLNKGPLSSTQAGSAPSGQRTFPGMPRPAPPVASRSPVEVEQLALEPADRAVCWGPQPPPPPHWGHLARARRPAPLPETSPWWPAPLALTGGVAWPPSPPLLQAPPSVW